MKLEDTKIKKMDLADKRHQWAKEMISNLTVKLPIMTSITKGTKSASFHFVGLARHATLAESLIYKSNRFRTTSEVYRAAMYFGMSILYELTKDEGTAKQKARADRIYKEIEVMESIDHSRQCIDAIVLSARDLVKCADTGIIDYEEMAEKISTLIDALPTELHQIAKEKIKRIMKGDSIVEIVETKLWRGAKGMKKRSINNETS